MSAGTGIQHSKMNASQTEQTKTIQLWVFPDKQDVKPRYEQKSFDIENQINIFVNIVSPKDKNDGHALGSPANFFLIWESSKKTKPSLIK